MSKSNTLLNMTKKPDTEKQDWHPADIKAAVQKQGTSLARLSRQNGLSNSMCGQALQKPYPKMERLIATCIGMEPQVIWPSRYNSDGTPKSGRGERGLGRHYSRLTSAKTSIVNDIPNNQSCNVNALDNGGVQHEKAA